MAYKSITTIVTSAEEAAGTVAAAAKVALATDAHLDILALGVDRTQIGYSYIGGGAMLMQVAMERAEQDAVEAEKAVRAAAESQPMNLRWSVESAVAQIGALNELVALKARFSDLAVLPRPYGKGRGPEAEAAIEAAMFEGQIPVLVVPGVEAVIAPPQRVVIGWNQSREAMAAVRAALPFLKAAQMVNIAVIDPPQHGPERSDPGGMLCQLLVRHGVKAEVSVLARSMPRISDVLARHLKDVNGDMLVMGAYGHSRFREAILGGATRNVLEQAEVPVLMAH